MNAWLCVAAVLAVQASAAPKPIETKHLTIAVSAGSIAAGKLPLYVDVTPREQMHVYAPGQPGYIAIELKLDAAAPVTAAGKAKYPAAEKIFMPALKETQLVYGKPFRITQDVTVRRGAPGPLTVTGTVRYQACDDTICYKPVTIPVTWTLSSNP